MQTRLLEIVVGLFLCLGVGAIFILTFQVSSLKDVGGQTYDITAKFSNVGGLKVGSPVSMAGVDIGRVTQIGFDPQDFEAVATLTIRAAYDNIPRDSSASILTAGLLGEKYIGLEPGGDMKSLKEGSKIKLTESALVLEQIIGQFLFSKAAEDKK